MDLAFTPALRDRMKAALQRFDRRAAGDAALRPAAVALIVMPDANGRACFVLTRRPLTMKRHAGQFALPGGRLDGDESALEAALRETHEEIGLHLQPDCVLGRLDDYATRSGFRITPIVAWGRDDTLVPSPDEVAAIYRVPLEELMAPDVVHLDPQEGSDEPVISLALLGNRVYAPTAAMLFQLREVALLDRATRVDRYAQPRFAWR